MPTRRGLLAGSQLEHADDSPDHANGVSSAVIRCLYEGQRAVAVGADATAKTQIAALVDLVDLHLHGDGQYRGIDVPPDDVAILLGGRHKGRREAIDALRILIGAMRSGPRVRLLEPDADGHWAAPTDVPWDVSDDSHYPNFSGLLAAVPADVPELVADLIQRVKMPALRAYPMLSGGGRWSIRLEGLEIGRFTKSGGALNVGKDGRNGGQSPARTAWISVNGPTPIHVGDEDPSSAAAAISAFADVWLPPVAPDGATPLRQNEHALESRILRGVVPIRIGGRELDVLRPSDTVNWGSQFPTKWGRDGSARYLDALMRDGSTPWAIEMKVQGASGVGQYYRHAIVQAVLYREFIRNAKPLHSWFDDHGLDATACEAAVVIPEIRGAQARWLPRLEDLCAVFDVRLVQVPPEHAGLHSRS